MDQHAKIRIAIIAIFSFQYGVSFAGGIFYPEMRKDLEKYHDPHRCTAQRPQWYLMYRNYYYDPYYGGTANCVKFQRTAPPKNFTMPATYSWCGPSGCGSIDVHYSLLSTPGYEARNLHSFTAKEQALTWEHHAIYVDCESCYIGRHHYALNGYGCTMWLPATPLSKESTEYCDFIFDVFCGSAPKFYMYNPSCPALLEKAASSGRGKV
uniref:Lipocalin n=1 Tax=Rhipicephalus zambeziensis TaxID=60191 RepID=A0A224YLT8_9ACAR